MLVGVTSGVGVNSYRYKFVPVSKEMSGNLYRCKVTSRAGTTYTNNVRLTVFDETLYKDQKPYVRVIYKDEIKQVQYDNPSDHSSPKYVDVRVIIKSFAELESATFSYDSISNKEILNIGTSYDVGVYNLQEAELIKVERAADVYEYTYTYNIKAYKNGIITVHVRDKAKREHSDSMTIDAIYDLKVSHSVSELSDMNNKVVVTFYANKKVRPYSSNSGGINSSLYTELLSLDGQAFAYQYTYKPSTAIPTTTFEFEDEYGNRAYDTVAAIARIEYRDVKFNNTSTNGITDMTAVDAYNVAQNLESETEINTNSDVQTRYGISKVQGDIFMARARDVGAVDILSNASNSKAYDGFYVREVEQSQTQDASYNYVSDNKNNYTSAIAGSNNKLSNENSNYVDTITDSSLYKGANVSGVTTDDENPYIYTDSSGRAVNINGDIYDASFRAVIVNN